MSTRFFWIAIALALLLSIVFRVEHVERRMLWADETWTALRISGHTYVELRQLFDGRVHSLSQIAVYQRVDPDRSIGATVSGLATEEPQHTPLFYAIDRAWASTAGSSIATLRLPAMLFSLFAIAAVAWLCFELSQSALVAGAGAALMALSPFFIDYGGQAREYSLWALMIALTGSLLVRALRNPSTVTWLWYGISMALALYSDLLMIAVLAAHAFYVVAFYRRNRLILVGFGCSVASALLAFAPWIAVALHGRPTILAEESWTHVAYPAREFAEKWAFNAGTVLFDAEYAQLRLMPVAAAMLILLTYGAFRLFREEKPRTTWLIAAPALVVALPQVLYDLATRGHESTESRYLIPLWLGLLLAAALLFGRRIHDSAGRTRTAWVGAFVLLLAVMAWSGAVNSAAVVWWDNDDNYPSTSMAARINAAPTPLVVSEGRWAEVLVMSHYVAPTTRFLLFKRTPPLPLRLARNTFLLAPSLSTIAAFKTYGGYALVPVPVTPLLSTALLGFRRGMLRTGGAVYVASFGGFLYRVVSVADASGASQRAAAQHRDVHGEIARIR